MGTLFESLMDDVKREAAIANGAQEGKGGVLLMPGDVGYKTVVDNSYKGSTYNEETGRFDHSGYQEGMELSAPAWWDAYKESGILNGVHDGEVITNNLTHEMLAELALAGVSIGDISTGQDRSNYKDIYLDSGVFGASKINRADLAMYFTDQQRMDGEHLDVEPVRSGGWKDGVLTPYTIEEDDEFRFGLGNLGGQGRHSSSTFTLDSQGRIVEIASEDPQQHVRTRNYAIAAMAAIAGGAAAYGGTTAGGTAGGTAGSTTLPAAASPAGGSLAASGGPSLTGAGAASTTTGGSSLWSTAGNWVWDQAKGAMVDAVTGALKPDDDSSGGGLMSGLTGGLGDIAKIAILYDQYERAQDSADDAAANYTDTDTFLRDILNEQGEVADLAQDRAFGEGDEQNDFLTGLQQGNSEYTDLLREAFGLQTGIAQEDQDPSEKQSQWLDVISQLREQERAAEREGLEGTINDTSSQLEALRDSLGDPKFYTQEDVANEAQKIFTGNVGSIDRALSIASSQSEADKLRRGLSDSTQAQDARYDIAREFSDDYAKLQSDAQTEGQGRIDAASDLQQSQRDEQIAELMATLDPELQARIKTFQNDGSGADAATAAGQLNQGDEQLKQALAEMLGGAAGDASTATNATGGNMNSSISAFLTAMTNAREDQLGGAEKLNEAAGKYAGEASGAAGEQLSTLLAALLQPQTSSGSSTGSSSGSSSSGGSSSSWIESGLGALLGLFSGGDDNKQEEPATDGSWDGVEDTDGVWKSQDEYLEGPTITKESDANAMNSIAKGGDWSGDPSVWDSYGEATGAPVPPIDLSGLSSQWNVTDDTGPGGTSAWDWMNRGQDLEKVTLDESNPNSQKLVDVAKGLFSGMNQDEDEDEDKEDSFVTPHSSGQTGTLAANNL